ELINDTLMPRFLLNIEAMAIATLL
ncbi:MAG: hypothetical protein QOJ54_936, partial [Aliidongia sp.]|nr:hypothetical protein [Aliidongia sp.]